MIYDVLEYLKKFFSSRLFVLSAAMIVMFSVILGRIFHLQIIDGASYQEKFTLKIQKPLTINASRGNIYDCEGRLLAYNELSYAVTIYDNNTYESNSQKNKQLNAELAEIISVIHRNREEIVNNFLIEYDEKTDSFSFKVSGNALNRFRADVFGRTSTEDFKYNNDLDFDEANATAENVMDFLMHNKKTGYGIHTEAEKTEDSSNEIDYYDNKTAYELTVLRYAIQANRYTKYKSTTIASDVSDKTVAYMNEHSDTLTGVEIMEETIRRYNYSKYFSSIIGYTGRISDAEYEDYHSKDESYTTNDIVGKTGLEQFYEEYLRGTNGEREVYVDNVGRISEVISNTDPIAGSDLYLSVDAELQEAVYNLLEQEIAGIIYSNIQENNIPLNDVYFALVNNNIIDINHFSADDASSIEKDIYDVFTVKEKQALTMIHDELFSQNPLTNNDMSEELLDYFTSAISCLKDNGIILSSEIDTNDEVYQNWRAGKISPKEYLSYCVFMQWIDISLLDVDNKYADSTEIYQGICDYLQTHLTTDKSFHKVVYHYLIKDGSITGKQLCITLYDQGVLDYDDDSYNKLSDGSLQPYGFILNKINNIEITPAQLALDPCTGSCIITDVNTGEIKALVSYPGFDNNKLANGVDADYFASLNDDLSNPQYNYATQERTAPGSTFKMVTSTAGLAEGVISTTSEFNCTGIFNEVDNHPKCWIYPKGSHGDINVSEALRDSCNVFYYTVGYNLSKKNTGIYDDNSGTSYLQKYATAYGLNEKTGLEIEENKPEIATEYPVMAAIGQSNNNFTTASLSRYVTAVTTGKLYNYQLMNKIVDASGNVIDSYNSTYKDVSELLTTEEWDAIHSGMRMVTENLECFDDFDIIVAGKTGTAQQVKTRPNHALFVGYAPYNNPKVSIATRIAYGYTSHNAAAVSKNILSYYFGKASLDSILSGNAEGANASAETAQAD